MQTPLVHPMEGVHALTSDPRFQITAFGWGEQPGWASKAVFHGRTYTITVLASRTATLSHVSLATVETGEIIERRTGSLDEVCTLAVRWAEKYEKETA